MVTVYTKNDLQKALEAKEKCIIVRGELANAIKAKAKRKKKLRNAGIASVGVGLAAIVAAPFTAGTSIAAGIAAAGLTVGGVTISTAELLIIVGGALGITGLLRGYNVKFNPDGSVTIEKDNTTQQRSNG